MHATSGRLTEQWEPLKAYFNSEPTDYIMENGKKKRVDENTRAKVKKIRITLNFEGLQLSFIFLKDDFPRFIYFKMFFFQTASRVACLMKHKMDTLLKDVLMCYVKHNVINSFSDVQT